MSFEGRPYLSSILNSDARNLVLRWSRQTEKSTTLAVRILHLAATIPGIQLLYVCPREEQARTFIQSKLMPLLRDSPFLREHLLGSSTRKPPVKNMLFQNGSQLFTRAAFRSADAVRGISADELLVDEFQDCSPGDLPVLRETLTHSTRGTMVLVGTPKLIDNPLEQMFQMSTANVWTTTCSNCQAEVVPDEHCIGPTCIVCPKCQRPINLREGRWVPKNPAATWGHGYCVNYLMTPWLRDYEEVLERQRSYDLAKFKNEVLALPVSLGEHCVSMTELEACCSDRPLASSIEGIKINFRQNIVAGIDWGGGGSARTVVAIGYIRPDGVVECHHFARFRADEDPEEVVRQVTGLCNIFRVRWIGADGGGNGSVYNRLLLTNLPPQVNLYAIHYGSADTEPYRDGMLWRWTVSRTGSIGYVIACVKKQKIQFPRLADCRGFLEEFACVTAEYDEQNHRVKYTHPTSQPDDALHSVNYAMAVIRRGSSTLAGTYNDSY